VSLNANRSERKYVDMSQRTHTEVLGELQSGMIVGDRSSTGVTAWKTT